MSSAHSYPRQPLPELTEEEKERSRLAWERYGSARREQEEIETELQALEDTIVRTVAPGSGAYFRDGPDTPEMVVVPAGEFMKGPRWYERRRPGTEYPRHKAKIRYALAVSRYPVTFDEWDAAQCSGYRPSDAGWGRADRPVVNVSWSDAQTYIAWLRKRTGRFYRLLYDSEWEYACRAGTRTPFWWGLSVNREQANCKNGDIWLGWGRRGSPSPGTVPVHRYQPNPWGLYQMHGNIWEWCDDRWLGDSDDLSQPCRYIVRGGSFADAAIELRSASRWHYPKQYRSPAVGFRVCRAVGYFIRHRVEFADAQTTGRYPEPVLGPN